MTKRRELAGQTFGKWKVLKRTGYFTTKLGKKTSLALWLCQCECGEKAKVIMSNLTTGKTKNCRKCADAKTAKQNRCENIWESAFRKKVIYRCNDRNIKCKLDWKSFKQIVENPCYYCGDSPQETFNYKKSKRLNGEQIIFNGIDRLNSKLGYTKDNCVPCCFKCNIMKNILNYEEFLMQINKIYKHKNSCNN